VNITRYGSIAAVAVAAALVLSACGGQPTDSGDGEGLSGPVVADGSSTVAPLTEAAADIYRDIEPGVNVTVATSGTGGGFAAFCAGETDISNASREIKEEEAAECEANGIEFTEIVMATLLGWWFFGDLPDRWTVLGVAVLIGSAFYISVRERRVGKNSPSQRPAKAASGG